MSGNSLLDKLAERWVDDNHREFLLSEVVESVSYPIIQLLMSPDKDWIYEMALKDAVTGLVAIKRRPIKWGDTPAEKKQNIFAYLSNSLWAIIAGSCFRDSSALLLRKIKAGLSLEIQYFDESAERTEVIHGARIFSNQSLYQDLLKSASDDERAARRRNSNEVNQIFHNEFERILVRRLATNLSPTGELFAILIFNEARKIGFGKFLALAWTIWRLRFRGIFGTDAAFGGNPFISQASRLMWQDICDKAGIPFCIYELPPKK